LDEVVKSRLGEESFVEEENDPFKKAHSKCSETVTSSPGSAEPRMPSRAVAIKFNQPVGSMSISPASRDVALAS
jgi:hypothetical protein